MPKAKRMCSNIDCERYGDPTGLLGGCECGSPLVPYAAPEPTDDQLQNVMSALGFHALASMRDRFPRWREAALNLHKLVQRVADGDPEAEITLSAMMKAFGDS